MGNTNIKRRWTLLGMSAVLAAGLLAAAAAPASAQVRFVSRYSRSQDWDRDGIPNWRDSHPRRFDRVVVRGWRSHNWRVNDRDRDGIRDSRDRDRDGDGIRNTRDRHPNNRWRR
jgi:hypothetical protein